MVFGLAIAGLVLGGIGVFQSRGTSLVAWGVVAVAAAVALGAR